jgi:hypothetical protein
MLLYFTFSSVVSVHVILSILWSSHWTQNILHYRQVLEKNASTWSLYIVRIRDASNSDAQVKTLVDCTLLNIKQERKKKNATVEKLKKNMKKKEVIAMWYKSVYGANDFSFYVFNN